KHPKKNALNPLVIRHFRGVFSQNQVQNSGYTTSNAWNEPFRGAKGKSIFPNRYTALEKSS
ncbi:MAG: hypothetical protein FWF59_01725, partial [Turicibacter sp.]|nr:hypothetical protein [Turicibacter sp.]